MNQLRKNLRISRHISYKFFLKFIFSLKMSEWQKCVSKSLVYQELVEIRSEAVAGLSDCGFHFLSLK